MKEGMVLGPWSLSEKLGEGGNAWVWKAEDKNGAIVALKILKKVDPNSEPYKRFRDEIGFLTKSRDEPGILPYIHFHLPERPSKKNRAWLAMPLAQGIQEALGASPDLEEVVAAVAAIAATLAVLAEKGIAHRDVKPANLYHYAGEWVIGDFGLVRYPDKETLTESGGKLGPRHYLAPEMLSSPKRAEGTLADVYSLAKTLWVLATGQNYPPPGEQRVDVVQMTLSANVSHQRANQLDRLIEIATRHDPDRRLTMNEFASELRTWLENSPKVSSVKDTSYLAPRIEALLEPRRRVADKVQYGISQAQKILTKSRKLMRPIADEIQSLGLPVREIGGGFGKLFDARRRDDLGRVKPIWKNSVGIDVVPDGGHPVILLCGVVAKLIDGDRLHLAAAYVVDGMGAYGGYQVLWQDTRMVRIGLASQDVAVSELTSGLKSNLNVALEEYAALLDQSSTT